MFETQTNQFCSPFTEKSRNELKEKVRRLTSEVRAKYNQIIAEPKPTVEEVEKLIDLSFQLGQCHAILEHDNGAIHFAIHGTES